MAALLLGRGRRVSEIWKALVITWGEKRVGTRTPGVKSSSIPSQDDRPLSPGVLSPESKMAAKAKDMQPFCDVA